MLKPLPVNKKQRSKRKTPTQRIIDAAWRFIFDQTDPHSAKHWRNNEKRFADVVRRILREVARG